MNRQLLWMFVVTLTTAFVQTGLGQGQPYPSAGPYPAAPVYAAQPAVYMNVNPAATNVYPATMAAMLPGNVQPAGCSTCGPAPAYGGGPVMYEGGSPVAYDGGSSIPCDGACPDGGGLFGGGNLFGGCGLFNGCGPFGGCGDSRGCGLLGCGLLGRRCADGCCQGGWGHCLGGCHDEWNAGGGCCLPRTFDVHAEWLFWTRDYDNSLQFSSDGILGPDALNADQLDFSEESGVRITGAVLVGVGSALEITYFGGLNWASGAHASSPQGNLFSVFSDFGSNPLNGFPETDFANLHQIGLSSELDNGEINLRHRWTTAGCLFHSSVLVGARYFRLREDLIYQTSTSLGAMDYRVKTDNDLVGAQIGGDTYLSITPRLRIGAEAEAGLFGTSSSQRTRMSTTTGPSLREYDHENDVAFLAEAGVMALFRATSHVTLRIGYQVMFVDGVALAVENFNTASPFSARDSFLDNSSDVLYHGAALGFEWTH